MTFRGNLLFFLKILCVSKKNVTIYYIGYTKRLRDIQSLFSPNICQHFNYCCLFNRHLHTLCTKWSPKSFLLFFCYKMTPIYSNCHFGAYFELEKCVHMQEIYEMIEFVVILIISNYFVVMWLCSMFWYQGLPPHCYHRALLQPGSKPARLQGRSLPA